MSSTIKESNKLEDHNQQRSSSGSTLATSRATNPTLKKGRGNNTKEEEVGARRIKRRPTKIALNDTLRRIRYLIIEGRSNSEIQDILKLEERTFYRYMAKIYEIDQALFAEQGKKIIATGIHTFKDRLLKSYRWYLAMAYNENIKVDIRMVAQRHAIDLAIALFKLEGGDPRILEEGERLLERLDQNSK
jgi:DNA-binding CsgD family transcriptional regulator